MDGRGLMLAALALAGCRDARATADPGGTGVRPAAEPRHGIEVPSGWKELETVAAKAEGAARAVLGEDADTHAHAWGETSRGCFLAIVEAHGTRKDTIVNLSAELQNAVGAEVEVTEWTAAPDAEDTGELHARWASGRLRAHLVLDGRKNPHAVAAACFYTDRQPAVCDAACAPMLATLAPLEVEP